MKTMLLCLVMASGISVEMKEPTPQNPLIIPCSVLLDFIYLCMHECTRVRLGRAERGLPAAEEGSLFLFQTHS